MSQQGNQPAKPATEASEADQFKITNGLGELLESTFEQLVGSHTKVWVDQIRQRLIGNELRLVLAALGYITSREDSRVRKLEPPATPRPLKPVPDEKGK